MENGIESKRTISLTWDDPCKKFEGKAINYKKDGTPFIMYWKVLPIKVGKKIQAWVAIQREGSVI